MQDRYLTLSIVSILRFFFLNKNETLRSIKLTCHIIIHHFYINNTKLCLLYLNLAFTISTITNKINCRNPGLNQGPLDLQSNALPTELFRLRAQRAVMRGGVANTARSTALQDATVIVTLSRIKNKGYGKRPPTAKCKLVHLHQHEILKSFTFYI